MLEERIRRAGKTNVAAEPAKATNQPVKKSSDNAASVEKKSSKPAAPQSKYVCPVAIIIACVAGGIRGRKEGSLKYRLPKNLAF